MSLTNKALFIIERNISGDLSLAEIAKRCDVSRFHLAHAFGESTGQPVMEYVRGRRLTEAAYALASGADDILSVALDAVTQLTKRSAARSRRNSAGRRKRCANPNPFPD